VAVLDFSLIENITRGDYGHILTWGPLATGDEGTPVSMIGSSRRTIQVIGAFGGGSRLTVEGSNNKVDWSPVTDVHGNQLVFSGPGISTVADLTLWIRPRASTGNPAATVIMLMRKTEMR
jgi:hypothetical protein